MIVTSNEALETKQDYLVMDLKGVSWSFDMFQKILRRNLTKKSTLGAM
jgi:hypothetical protein